MVTTEDSQDLEGTEVKLMAQERHGAHSKEKVWVRGCTELEKWRQQSRKASTGWRLLGKVLGKRDIEKRRKASLLQDTLIPSAIKML